MKDYILDQVESSYPTWHMLNALVTIKLRKKYIEKYFIPENGCKHDDLFNLLMTNDNNFYQLKLRIDNEKPVHFPLTMSINDKLESLLPRILRKAPVNHTR